MKKIRETLSLLLCQKTSLKQEDKFPQEQLSLLYGICLKVLSVCKNNFALISYLRNPPKLSCRNSKMSVKFVSVDVIKSISGLNRYSRSGTFLYFACRPMKTSLLRKGGVFFPYFSPYRNSIPAEPYTNPILYHAWPF